MKMLQTAPNMNFKLQTAPNMNCFKYELLKL